MGWKNLLHIIKTSGHEVYDTAREKIREAASNAPLPGFGSEEEEEIEPDNSKDSLNTRRKKTAGGPMWDLDAPIDTGGQAVGGESDVGRPSEKTPHPRPGTPAESFGKGQPPPFPPSASSASNQPSSPEAPPSPPGTHGAAGFYPRQKGEKEPPSGANRVRVSQPMDTSYQRKSSTVDFIERRYGAYGAQVAAAILAHALQPGGIQRLMQRLDLKTWNNDALDHDEILRFIQNKGLETFCKALGIRLNPSNGKSSVRNEDTDTQDDDASHRALSIKTPAGSDTGQGGKGAIPTARPSAMRLSRGGEGDGSAGASPRIKLEGQDFKPIPIQERLPRRFVGKMESPAALGAGQPLPASPPTRHLAAGTGSAVPSVPLTPKEPGDTAKLGSSPAARDGQEMGLPPRAASQGLKTQPASTEADTQEIPPHPPCSLEPPAPPSLPAHASPPVATAPALSAIPAPAPSQPAPPVYPAAPVRTPGFSSTGSKHPGQGLAGKPARPSGYSSPYATTGPASPEAFLRRVIEETQVPLTPPPKPAPGVPSKENKSGNLHK